LNTNRKGWLVVFAGFGINLAFGVLYSWSIFSKALIDMNGWTRTEASLPYTVAIFVFALMMIPAGKLQDRFGARLIASLGGIFTGTGFILASYFPTLPGLIVSFGILAGAGIGMGYASATPAAVKWFDSSKKGLVAGIVVAGFGLSTLYMAPLVKHFIADFGIFQSFRILGIAFLVAVVGLSQFFSVPDNSNASAAASAEEGEDVEWRDMIRTKQFYQLWLILASGALGGLMIIGHLSKIVSIQSGMSSGFILVALMALFNASGRPLAGLISDRIGRSRTLIILFFFQGVIFLLFSKFTGFATLLLGSAVVTFVYGSMFSIFPSIVSDYYGKKNLGINYGILFSAWGIGGVAGPMLAGKIADISGSYGSAYAVAASLCFIAVFTAWRLKPYSNKDKDKTRLNINNQSICGDSVSN